MTEGIPMYLHYIQLWFIYTVSMSMGMGLIPLSYMTLLVINTIHIWTCLMLYIDGGNTSPMQTH